MPPSNSNNPKLWTKEFSLILALNLLLFIVTYILMSTMPLYIQEIGGNRLLAGLTSSLFTLGGFLARPWVGRLLDRKGRKRILLLGNFLLFIPVAGYSLVQSAYVLLFLRLLQGIACSAVSTAALTIASDLIPAARRYEGIGCFGISNAAAMAIGPAVGLYFIEYFAYPKLYLLTAFLVLAIIAMGFFAKQDRRPPAEKLPTDETDRPSARGVRPWLQPKGKKSPVQLANIFEKTALLPSAIYFLISLTAAVIVTFIPSYQVAKGIEHIGLFYVVYAVVLLFTRPLTGRVADRVGPSKIILPGLLLIAAAFLILYPASTLAVFLLAGALYGLGMGSVLPVLNTLVINFAPAEKRGAANATYLAANDIGSAVGAALWGIVALEMGFSYLYLLSPLFIGLALLVYLLALKPKLKWTPVMQNQEKN